MGERRLMEEVEGQQHSSSTEVCRSHFVFQGRRARKRDRRTTL